MRVGERAKVLRLDRPTDEDRAKWEGGEGLLMRRLNVPWTPDYGALWELRFDDGATIVFSESELGVVRADGSIGGSGIDDVREDWGEAPRTPSLPFRRFGAGSTSVPAVLALLVFALSGILLVWAGVAESSIALSAAGAVLVLIGIGTAGVLIR